VTPILTEAKLRVIGGNLTIRGRVTGHDEHEDGSMFETAPIQVLDLGARTAKTKSVTYTIEGEIK
jgi:hypothetical protein